MLLAPTSPTTAFELGAKTADPLVDVPDGRVHDPDATSPATRRSACRSAPTPTGLPVGVQVLAPALGEPVMFRVARAIEEAAP